MKKILFTLLAMIISFSFVKAETYYINDNNVEFTKEEYDFITSMYWDGYQNFVTLKDLEKIRDLGLIEKTIEKVQINEIIPLSSVTEKGRTFDMTKSCSSECLIVIATAWGSTPTVRSFDVIGARIDGTSITQISRAVVTGKDYSKTYTSPNKLTNGFGYSVQIPNTSNIKISTSFYANKKGKVYGSYQHAKSSITESNSKLYTLSAGGAGGVFLFYGKALGVYDQASGLNVSL